MDGEHHGAESIHHARATSRGGKLLIEEPPLQILPSLAVAIGLNEAIFLQQLHYWVRMSSHVHNGRRWVYNSLADWQKQFPFWSDRTLRRVIKSLESPLPRYDRALIVSTLLLNAHPMDKTKWYTLDYELVDALSAPTDSVETLQVSHRGGQSGHLMEVAPQARGGQSDLIEGSRNASPSGQIGHFEGPHWLAPSGQIDHLDWPRCPSPTGQIGHFSLQRLPETTDKTPTACARAHEKSKSKAASRTNVSAPPVTQSLATEGVPRAEGAPRTTALKPAGGLLQQATALVQAFHQQFHGVTVQTPHRAELAHASALLRQYGSGFATFFLMYAQRAVRHEGRTVHVFGGIMCYEASALSAYQRHESRQAKQRVEASAEHQRHRLDMYETWLRKQLEAFKQALPLEQLKAMRTQAQRRLDTAEKVPRYALERCVAHEVDTQLMQDHALPSFEIWSEQYEMQQPDIVLSDSQENLPHFR